MTVATPLGRFVWFDLMTSDPEAAIRFYSSVAGWGTQKWDGPMAYTMWTAGGVPIGGVMQLPSTEAHPHWLAYVSTPSVDDTAEKVKGLGGQVVVPPQDIPGVGRFSVITDPQGAYIALYSSATGEASDEAPTPGRFSWHELATTDGGAAYDFYSKLFGWEKTNSFDMGSGWMYQMYGLPGRELGGMFTKSPEMAFPPMWINYIMVDGVHAAAERITAGGGQVINGPMEVPGGDWIVQGIDPQGAMFALHSKSR